MPLDQSARNKLFRFVTDARRAVSADLAEQMQSVYGIGADGTVTTVAGLESMGRTEGEIGIAKLLAERLEHLVAQGSASDQRRALEFARLARELSFGIVNRLAAIRMAERRALLPPVLASYHESNGFVVYRKASNNAFASQHEAYVQFLRCVCDEMATDLGIVMDSRANNALLFPRERCLGEVIKAMNHGELEPLWGEDETIGWIYQYYNDPDERKLMREASQAPRDSRELAIRNQFFTPRYVVEFLTDNTLGRIWYEMTQGKTSLVDRCRYLVRRPQTKFLAAHEKASGVVIPPELPSSERLKLPEEVPYRPIKDPRELRFLDPACGSMHFGLYAFDLLEVIYAEAWDDNIDSLRTDFPVRDDFIREVPRLILEQNIYGVDIDARAVQIARLALWLRAQKSWQLQRIPPARRPRILRSHVVCAEPISADQSLVEDFIAMSLAGTPEKDALGRLMRRLVEQMRLAGEAGVLLRIEEAVKQLVSSEAGRDRRRESPDLPGLEGVQQRPLQDDLAGFSMSNITDVNFWDQAEQRLYLELNRFATRLEQGGLRRRMFAEDAAQGFAFVDLCRERFDVVVMNPPFGEWSVGFKKQSKELYPNSYCDILAAFVERGGELLHANGRLGAITSRTCFFLSSYTKWREEVVLKAFEPKLLVDLGHGVMDEAMVEAAAYVFLNRMPEITCFRLLDTESPAGPLAEAVRQLNEGRSGAAVFTLDSVSFGQVPNAPFAYWVEEKVRRLFKELPAFESEGRTARVGLQTGDDFRFVRCWWECADNAAMKPFAKGGGVSPFYADIFMRVNWRHDGAELYASDSARVQNTDFYFKPGCFQTLRSLRLAPHITPCGCVFSHNGFQYFANESDLIWLLGLTNSNFFESLYRLNVGKDEMPLFIAGVMQLVPVPIVTAELKAEIELFTLNCWNNRRQLSIRSERSPWFRQPFSLVGTIAETASHEQKIINQLDSDFLYLSQKIDALALKAYGNVQAISVGHSSRTRPIDVQGDEEESDESDSSLGPAIFSYLFGLAFGRWSLTQLKQSPDAGLPSDPLTELPDVPPGSIGANPRLYAVSGDISDDEIISLIRSQLSKIFKGDSEAELCNLLKANTLLEYLEKPSAFFADHLKVYSKSRRKAPVYWPLSTRSGEFVIWVYYLKLDADSLPRLITEVLDPRLCSLNAEISALAAEGQTAARRSKLEALRLELAEMRQDFHELITKGYKPSLNDGVMITACPLAKYFRHPGFRKELEACWKKLSQGDYDWAHLAMSMWPNRVLEVCKKDRSIAIAHGKEELCPAEPVKASRNRKKPN